MNIKIKTQFENESNYLSFKCKYFRNKGKKIASFAIIFVWILSFILSFPIEVIRLLPRKLEGGTVKRWGIRFDEFRYFQMYRCGVSARHRQKMAWKWFDAIGVGFVLFCFIFLPVRISHKLSTHVPFCLSEQRTPVIYLWQASRLVYTAVAVIVESSSLINIQLQVGNFTSLAVRWFQFICIAEFSTVDTTDRLIEKSTRSNADFRLNAIFKWFLMHEGPQGWSFIWSRAKFVERSSSSRWGRGIFFFFPKILL